MEECESERERRVRKQLKRSQRSRSQSNRYNRPTRRPNQEIACKKIQRICIYTAEHYFEPWIEWIQNTAVNVWVYCVCGKAMTDELRRQSKITRIHAAICSHFHTSEYLNWTTASFWLEKHVSACDFPGICLTPSLGFCFATKQPTNGKFFEILLNGFPDEIYRRNLALCVWSGTECDTCIGCSWASCTHDRPASLRQQRLLCSENHFVLWANDTKVHWKLVAPPPSLYSFVVTVFSPSTTISSIRLFIRLNQCDSQQTSIPSKLLSVHHIS